MSGRLSLPAATTAAPASRLATGPVPGSRPTGTPNVSPVLAEWFKAWATGLSVGAREELSHYESRFHRSMGDPEQELQRRWMIADWGFRSCVRRWLREAKLHPWADALDQLAPLSGTASLAMVCRQAPAVRQAARGLRTLARLKVVDERDRRGGPADVFDTLAAAVDTAVAEAAWPLVCAARGAGAGITVWEEWSDAVGYASASVAWSALSRNPVADRDEASAITRGALVKPAAELHVSAHDLVDRLLAVTEPAGASRPA